MNKDVAKFLNENNELINSLTADLYDVFGRMVVEQKLSYLNFCFVTARGVVVSFLIDCYRYDYFHGNIDTVDECKQAAYMTKWLARHRVIQLTTSNPEYLTFRHSYINEIYAAYVGFTFGLIDPEKLGDDKGESLWLFIYSLRYRNVLDGQSMISLFKVMQSYSPLDVLADGT